jgi:anti-sigma factor RsiW
MGEEMERIEEAALWRRWRSADALSPASKADLDPLLLAAYAEDRLAADTAEAVEEWLAANPEAASDVLAARRAAREAVPAAPEAVVARASALVPGHSAQILPFRRATPQMPTWRVATRWGAVAASVLVVGLVGFAFGTDTYLNLAGTASPTIVQDLADPPIGLFNNFDEDAAI